MANPTQTDKDARELKLARQAYESDRAAASGGIYGDGWAQMLMSSADVESLAYSIISEKIDEMAKGLKATIPSGADISRLAADKWHSLKGSEGSRISFILNHGGNGKTPSATVKNNATTESVSAMAKYTDAPDYHKTFHFLGEAGGFSYNDNALIAEGYTKNLKVDNESIAKSQQRMAEIAAKKQAVIEEREAAQAAEDNANSVLDSAVSRKEDFIREVSKYEYMICYKNNQDNPNVSRNYINRKHPDSTEEYLPYAKGVVAVPKGYRAPKLPDYDETYKGDMTKLSRLEAIKLDTEQQYANTYTLAQRLHAYDPNHPMVKSFIESRNGDFKPLESRQGLANVTKEVDNSYLLVPAYKLDDNNRAVFQALQDFHDSPDFKGKFNRKGSSINEAFLPVHRGNNFPPKKIFVVEGVSTAISAATLNNIKNLPDADDYWVVSAFTADNIKKVAKDFSYRMPNSEILIYGDNDEKILRNEDETAILNEQGQPIPDPTIANAGREALRDLWFHSTLNPVITRNKQGNLTAVVRKITGVLMPLKHLNYLDSKVSDVNDVESKWIKDGLSLTERRQLFKTDINGMFGDMFKKKQAYFTKYWQSPENKPALIEAFNEAKKSIAPSEPQPKPETPVKAAEYQEQMSPQQIQQQQQIDRQQQERQPEPVKQVPQQNLQKVETEQPDTRPVAPPVQRNTFRI